MWELDYKQSWVPKNWFFWTVVLEKTLESPLDFKEIQPVHPKGNQSWIFIGRTDAEALTLWPPDVRSWLIRKDPDAGKDWRQEEKGKREDKMIRWLHQLKGHEFEQAPGDGEGQGSLAAACIGSQRVGHDWVTEQQILKCYSLSKVLKQLRFFPKGNPECFFFQMTLAEIAKFTHPSACSIEMNSYSAISSNILWINAQKWTHKVK